MKRVDSISALILLASATFAFGGLRVPSSVFTMEELEQAMAEAQEDEKPLIFLYTDPGST